jgi:superfamily II DNA or RNA helicase
MQPVGQTHIIINEDRNEKFKFKCWIGKMIDLSRCNKFETDFYNSIISFIVPHFRDKQFVFPQKEFIDSSGKTRRIDFAIISKSSKIAIELDGYTYHAENVISRRAFDDQLNRQNDIIGAGYKVLRFSFDQFTREPQKCADILRRNLLGDNELHPFLARQKIGPHMVQREALNAIENSRKKGKNAGLIVLATGLGKTHLAAFDAKNNASRILFIAHNLTILRQAQRTFEQILESKTSGLFTANEREIDVDMLFASIHSLYRNLDKFHPNDFDYIIFDEFHHAAAPTFNKVLQFFKPNFLLGLTATPNRTDRKSILPLVKRNIFYEMNADLAIERGFLVPFRYYGFSDNIDYSNIKHNGYKYDINDLNKKLLIDKRDEAIIGKYHEYAQGNKAIGFCVSIEHTERSVRKFSEQGIASVAIHSKLSQDDRKNRMLSFRNGEAQIAFVRDLFNEGVDVPDVSTLLFYAQRNQS